jgi:hypothetical protein
MIEGALTLCNNVDLEQASDHTAKKSKSKTGL